MKRSEKLRTKEFYLKEKKLNTMGSAKRKTLLCIENHLLICLIRIIKNK